MLKGPGRIHPMILQPEDGEPRRVIVHVARNPATGVWTVIRQLATVQRAPGTLTLLGVLGDSRWPAVYRDELHDTGQPYLYQHVAASPGTVAFTWMVLRNPVRAWARALRMRFPRAELVFHMHNAWLSGAYLPLDPAASVGAVATFHGVAAEHRFRAQRWYRAYHGRFARRLLDHGAALTAVSRATVELANELFAIPRDVFSVVPNGIQSAGTARTLGHGLRVGFLGQIHEGKGWHLALDAIGRLREQGIDARLEIAGGGPEADRVKDAAARAPDLVRWHGFVRDPESAFFPLIDALILPTHTEGLPMAVLEAMAHGIVPVVTPVGGIPDLVQHEQNGLFIERDATVIAAQLSELARAPERYAALSRNAIETVRTGFSLEVVRAAYDRVYEVALASHRAKRRQ